jgi:hypothetical protein
MSAFRLRSSIALRRGLCCLALLAVVAVERSAVGQVQPGGFFTSSAVGGVSIDPDGVLNQLTTADRQRLKQQWQAALAPVSGDLKTKTPLRRVSLRRLDEAIAEHRKTGQPLSDEMYCLAGLQRVEYVFVYPEQRDIVLAGPAEGWVVGQQGDVVGATTGRPVLLLDDLLVALRTAESSRSGGISCSIDPTPEGLARLKEAVSRMSQIGPNPQATLGEIERSLGPQKITVGGVPADSHFANVLVAADYRMKRLAMKFDPPPIAGLPAYLDLAQTGATGMSNVLPRWWLATNYEALGTDGDGLAWQLRGQGVRAVAEEDYLSGERIERTSGKASGASRKWADNMTARYEALAAKEAIFGQLRNCMDLAVVAALIEKEQLREKAGCPLSVLTDNRQLPQLVMPAPKQVDSKSSFVKKGRKWLISASGGVQIDAWNVASQRQTNAKLAETRGKAPDAKDRWWWN